MVLGSDRAKSLKTNGRIFEVHISNPAAREAFRTTNYVAPCAEACIAGFGARGYLMALDAALEK